MSMGKCFDVLIVMTLLLYFNAEFTEANDILRNIEALQNLTLYNQTLLNASLTATNYTPLVSATESTAESSTESTTQSTTEPSTEYTTTASVLTFATISTNASTLLYQETTSQVDVVADNSTMLQTDSTVVVDLTSTTTLSMNETLVENSSDAVSTNASSSTLTLDSTNSTSSLTQSTSSTLSTAATDSVEQNTTTVSTELLNTTNTTDNVEQNTTTTSAEHLNTTNATDVVSNETTVTEPTTTEVQLTTIAFQLNVTSIINVLANSNATQKALLALNTTDENKFFQLLANYIENLDPVSKEMFINSTAGQLLSELIRTNDTAILGQYSALLNSETDKTYLYAILLDYQDNSENSSFFSNFIRQIESSNNETFYRLNEQTLLSQTCEVYKSAGGTSSMCVDSTTQPTTTRSSSVPVAVIVGCTVGAGALLIVAIAVGYHLCNKQSKVTPSEAGSNSFTGSRNAFGEGSMVSLRPMNQASENV